MSSFTDSMDQIIRYLPYDLVGGETSEPIVIRVVPSAGAVLMSEQSDSVKLKAREHGTSDDYVDLAGGIDLSDYAPGAPVEFDLVCEAIEDLDGLIRETLFVGVVNSGGAAWSA